MKKQTAVQWYSDKLLEILGDKVNEFTQEQTLANHYAFQQAKEMEKEQIQDAYYHGIWLDESKVHSPYIAAEDYYTSTYES